MNSICLNGKILSAEKPALMASNRSYRYGDGLFETIKVAGDKIVLEGHHFDRLFSGLALLKFEIPRLFTREKLGQVILQLCRKNECASLGRVRLSVFRGNGGLYDESKTLEYLVECWPLDGSINKLNENGLVIDIYQGAKKNCDQFSNLKSANFLPYSMAALYAKEKKLNDCLLLNVLGGIADSTIANLFLVTNEMITTPSLAGGCVGGVMRRYLTEQLQAAGYKMVQASVSSEDVTNADEVFLTNAIYGIRWVKQFRDKIYTNAKTVEIYDRFVKPTTSS